MKYLFGITIVLICYTFSFFSYSMMRYSMVKITPETKTTVSAIDQTTIPYYVSANELYIINHALKMRPDKFSDWYHGLWQKQKEILLSVSTGIHDTKIPNEEKESDKKLPLYVPELRQKIFGAYFGHNIHEIIKEFASDLHNDEKLKNAIKAYCTKKLLMSKSQIFEKSAPFTTTRDYLKEMALSSLCMECYHTAQPFFTTPLSWEIAGNMYQVYAAHYGINDCQYCVVRVPSKSPHSYNGYDYKICIIDSHNNVTFSETINHISSIEGTLFCKDKRDSIRYVITYSQKDCIVTSLKEKQEHWSFSSQCFCKNRHGRIIDVVFDDNIAKLYILFRDTDNERSVVVGFNTDGITFFSLGFPFRDFYYLDKLCITNRGLLYSKNNRGLILIFNKHDSWVYYWNPATNSMHFSYYVQRFPLKDQFYFVYDIEDKILDKNACITYSPDGKFLLKNFLQKGIINSIITQLIDRKTGEIILNFGRMRYRFLGVGFSKDGKRLIFLNAFSPNTEVDLDYSEHEAKLNEFEQHIMQYKNNGILPCIKELCDECDKNEIIMLPKWHPVRCMLQEWYNSSEALKYILGTCFPINKIEKHDS